MEGDGNPAPSAGSRAGEKGVPCEECGEQPWKYRCPGCSGLTCSLPCVQSHKRRTACTGKRPRTVPVPLSGFDDAQLLSDYNLLEETKQLRESAHRLIGGFGRNFGVAGGAHMPGWLFSLRKAAHRRGTRLLFLPRGMARREQNRSRHDNRKDCIKWTLEWRFNSTDVVLTDHEIDEHASLLSLMEKHLSPTPWKDQLTPYRHTELRDLKLFIQKSAKNSKSPYCQLHIEEPLCPQLRNILVVEYPTINVFLPSDSYDFEVEEIFNKSSRNEHAPGNSNDIPRMEGTEFHEEEIEEGELTSETQVIDLKDCGTLPTTNLTPVNVTSGSKIDGKSDSSLLSYVNRLALDGQQGDLNHHSNIALNTTSRVTKARSCMKVYPLDAEERDEREFELDRQAMDLKDHATLHPCALAPVKGTIVPNKDCKTDSSVPCSISTVASDALSGAQEKFDQQIQMMTPNATPEALKRKSCMKVYQLDTEDSQGLVPEVPNLEFDQEMKNAYEELFGDMNPDDFLNFDLELVDADEAIEGWSPLRLGDDLEDGEIPKA